MKFKIRFADKIVGIFSLAALGGLIALILSIGAANNWFAKKNNYYTFFDSGSGISMGMDLTYKGFSIGKVDSITLEGSMVRVDYYVLGEYAEYVKENSLVELNVSPIGLGSSFVFYPGSSALLLESGREIFRIDSEAGKRIIAENKISIQHQDDSIAALMNKVSFLLDNVNRLLGSVNDALDGSGAKSTPVKQIVSDVSAAIADLDSVLKVLASPEGAVPKLLGPQIAGDITEVLDNLSSLSGSADKLVANAVPEIDDALNELNVVLVELQDVLTGVKNNPLIRGGVPDRSSESSATTHMRDLEF